jgi:hypothetical protein
MCEKKLFTAIVSLALNPESNSDAMFVVAGLLTYPFLCAFPTVWSVALA